MNNFSIIYKYLNSQSRNKIVFFRNNIPDIEILNLGKELSNKINGLEIDNKISLKALLLINEILNESYIDHSDFGKYLAIENIGILLEPELKIDFVQLLNKHSSSYILFVKWDGEIENETLFFKTKERGLKIDIKNLSHITI